MLCEFRSQTRHVRVAAGFGVGFQVGKACGKSVGGAFEGYHRHDAIHPAGERSIKFGQNVLDERVFADQVLPNARAMLALKPQLQVLILQAICGMLTQMIPEFQHPRNLSMILEAHMKLVRADPADVALEEMVT